MMKKLGLLVAGVIAAVGLVANPAAAEYPPEPPPLVVADTTVAPGGPVTAQFTDCTLGEIVEFVLDADTEQASCLGSAGAFRLPTATGAGVATATLTAPTTPGTYALTATGLTSGNTASIIITVVGDAAPGTPGAPGGQLPETGSDSNSTVRVAAGFVVLGAGLATVGGIRRRRAHAHS